MKTFATKMIRSRGYSRDEAIREVAYIDGVSEEEAKRRYDAAWDARWDASQNRSKAQKKRQERIRKIRNQATADARTGNFDGDPTWPRELRLAYLRAFETARKEGDR